MTKQHQRVGAAIALGLFFAAFTIFYLVFRVPGNTREVTGAIISSELRKSDDGLRVSKFILVRLDEGVTVRAAIDADVAIKIGRRVRLIATAIRILGTERFHFKEFVDNPPDSLAYFFRNLILSFAVLHDLPGLMKLSNCTCNQPVLCCREKF
jgi:hypothetical protein